VTSDVEPDTKAIRNKRIELTAGYVDRMAGACFAAGVVAPAAAAVFGLTGPGTSLSTLTIALGATIFLLISLGLHLMARYLLKGLIR
jgi:hypothetical protein